MRELLTASRMGTFQQCQRRHYWRYEVGLQVIKECDAFRFGHAWHTAMEARWMGARYEDALANGAGTAEMTEHDCAVLAGLLAGYYGRYNDEIVKELHPEVEFRMALAGSRTFDTAGKIDGLGTLHDGRLCLVEHKTAGEDIGADSDYWLRLRFNSQIYQYVTAARGMGWDIALVLYDVTRKPMIRVKQGETVDGYAGRLVTDTQARPEFYYARREVPILDADIEAFEIQRLELSRQILMLRNAARRAKKPEHAWARNCSAMTCRGCEFSSFCLQNLTVDPAQPPAGFRIGETNPELSQSKGEQA